MNLSSEYEGFLRIVLCTSNTSKNKWFKNSRNVPLLSSFVVQYRNITQIRPLTLCLSITGGHRCAQDFLFEKGGGLRCIYYTEIEKHRHIGKITSLPLNYQNCNS